jgi:hypothetical protein
MHQHDVNVYCIYAYYIYIHRYCSELHKEHIFKTGQLEEWAKSSAHTVNPAQDELAFVSSDLRIRVALVLENFYNLKAVLRIRDILARIRIRISGSVPLTNDPDPGGTETYGSGFATLLKTYFRSPILTMLTWLD